MTRVRHGFADFPGGRILDRARPARLPIDLPIRVERLLALDAGKGARHDDSARIASSCRRVPPVILRDHDRESVR